MSIYEFITHYLNYPRCRIFNCPAHCNDIRPKVILVVYDWSSKEKLVEDVKRGRLRTKGPRLALICSTLSVSRDSTSKDMKMDKVPDHELITSHAGHLQCEPLHLGDAKPHTREPLWWVEEKQFNLIQRHDGFNNLSVIKESGYCGWCVRNGWDTISWLQRIEN